MGRYHVTSHRVTKGVIDVTEWSQVTVTIYDKRVS